MMRIAIVDDSGTARMFIQRCLEVIGFQDAIFIESANGQEALDQARQNPVDLLVTDLTMPVMDGETLLKSLKDSPTLKDLPVLIISSAGNPAKETELMKLGALAVLAKPFTPADLYRVLTPILQQEERNE